MMIIIIISSRAAEDWGLMVCLAPLKLQNLMCVCMHAKSIRLGLTLCNPMDCSLPSSSVHGILQARILEWVVMSFSRDLPDPGTEPSSPLSLALIGGFFTSGTTWEAHLGVRGAAICFTVNWKDNAEAETPILWLPDGKN